MCRRLFYSVSGSAPIIHTAMMFRPKPATDLDLRMRGVRRTSAKQKGSGNCYCRLAIHDLIILGYLELGAEKSKKRETDDDVSCPSRRVATQKKKDREETKDDVRAVRTLPPNCCLEEVC